MTNEEFKGIYNSYLSHAWVTSKDATKAAEQKRKQQEYNRKYYQNNKDKWNRETENQGLGTGTTGKTYTFRDERDRKENASAMARQAAGDIRRQQEEAAARERWEEQQRQKNARDLAQNARRELGTKDLKSNEAKGMEQAARTRRNRRVSENRRAIESEQMTKTRQQQNTRNKVKQKQIKESNVREDTFRTSSQRRKTGAEAERLARNGARIKADTLNRSWQETLAKERNSEKLRNKKGAERAKRRQTSADIKKAQSKVSEQYAANAKRRTVNSFKNDKSANEAAAYVNARNARRATRNRDEISYDKRNRSFQEGRAYKENRQAERRKRARKSPVQSTYREFKGIEIRDRRPSDNASRAEQSSRSATSLNRMLKKNKGSK